MRMFVTVKALWQRVPGGRLVIFRLVERPILKDIVLIGNVDQSTKTLIKESGIKKGDAADPYEVEEGRRRLEDFYHKKGYNKVRITVVEGNKPGQLRAVYTINEGPKTKVWAVKVVGATVVSGMHLQYTVPKTEPPLLFHLRRRTRSEGTRRRLSSGSPPITAAWASSRPASDASWNTTRTRPG